MHRERERERERIIVLDLNHNFIVNGGEDGLVVVAIVHARIHHDGDGHFLPLALTVLRQPPEKVHSAPRDVDSDGVVVGGQGIEEVVYCCVGLAIVHHREPVGCVGGEVRVVAQLVESQREHNLGLSGVQRSLAWIKA